MSPDPRRRSVTLLETVLAIGLLVVFLSLMFQFYDRSLEASNDGTARSRKAQLARVVLQRIANEIRQCSGNTGGFGPGLVGEEHAVSVNTLVLPDEIVSRRRSLTDEEIAAQFDLREIRYYIAWDDENLDEEGNPRSLGLARRESKTFNRGVFVERESDQEDVEDEQALAVKEELYAPEIKFIEFKYFDGASWWDNWQLMQGNSLPLMVRVTLGFTPLPPEEEERQDMLEDNFLRDEAEQDPLEPDRYTMFVRPLQADVNPIGVRLQRQASAFAESEEAL